MADMRCRGCGSTENVKALNPWPGQVTGICARCEAGVVGRGFRRKFPDDRSALLAIQGLLRRPKLRIHAEKPRFSRNNIPLDHDYVERPPVYRGDWTMTTEWKLDPTRKPGRYSPQGTMDFTDEALSERAMGYLGFDPNEKPEDILFI